MLGPDTDQLIVRLREVTTELSSLHRELAMVEVAEAQAKAESYRRGDQPSVSAADRAASLYALDHHVEVIRLRGEIAAYEQERTYVLAMIELRKLNE